MPSERQPTFGELDAEHRLSLRAKERAVASERERCRQAVMDGLREFGAIPGGNVDSCCAHILLKIVHG